MEVKKRDWWRLRPWTRHSSVLFVAGFVYISVGFSYISSGNVGYRNSALPVAISWMPLKYWGIVFCVAGIMSIISTRWPEFMETWGYMVLTGLSACWSAMYATSIVFAGAPVTGWTGASLWGLIAFLWWAISGLINPNTIPGLNNGPD